MRCLVPIAVLLMLCGCFLPEKVDAPKARTQERITTRYFDGTTETVLRKTESRGAGYRGDNAEGFKSDGVSVADGKARGGGGEYVGDPNAGGKAWQHYLIGGLLIALGALVCYFGNIRLGLFTAGAGIVIIAVVEALVAYPWVPWVVAGAIASYWLYHHWRGQRALEVERVLVNEIENSPNGTSVALKKRIAHAAGTALEKFRAEVRRVKKELGIKPPMDAGGTDDG